MLSTTMLNRLTELFGVSHVLSDPLQTQAYALDWTTLYTPNASAVVFPTEIDQVVELVQMAMMEGMALVPSGGRTGLVGGAVASHGEVVVSFEKMNRILASNEFDATVCCEPGVVLQTLQESVKAQGYYYPVDLAARGSCQIGGNIATNAGGLHVIRYGSTRNWVAGLKVVTGEGECLNLNRGLVKNATGYDLRHLFTGSEGTLGLIVEATLHVTAPPNASQVVLFSLSEIEAMLPLMHLLRSRLPLMAVEFFSEASLEIVLEQTKLVRPIEKASYYVLAEFETEGASQEQAMLAIYEKAHHKKWILDAIISQSEKQKAQLWEYRERITETIAQFHPYKQDVAVLTSQVSEFVQALEQGLQTQFPGLQPVLFGHIGDGNVHVNILPAASQTQDAFMAQFDKLNDWLFALVSQFKGTIAAEHGVGLLKSHYLSYSRSASELLYFKRIKAAFDPKGILNPGKLID